MFAILNPGVRFHLGKWLEINELTSYRPLKEKVIPFRAADNKQVTKVYFIVLLHENVES